MTSLSKPAASSNREHKNALSSGFESSPGPLGNRENGRASVDRLKAYLSLLVIDVGRAGRLIAKDRGGRVVQLIQEGVDRVSVLTPRASPLDDRDGAEQCGIPVDVRRHHRRVEVLDLSPRAGQSGESLSRRLSRGNGANDGTDEGGVHHLQQLLSRTSRSSEGPTCEDPTPTSSIANASLLRCRPRQGWTSTTKLSSMPWYLSVISQQPLTGSSTMPSIAQPPRSSW